MHLSVHTRTRAPKVHRGKAITFGDRKPKVKLSFAFPVTFGCTRTLRLRRRTCTPFFTCTLRLCLTPKGYGHAITSYFTPFTRTRTPKGGKEGGKEGGYGVIACPYPFGVRHRRKVQVNKGVQVRRRRRRVRVRVLSSISFVRTLKG